MTAFTPREETVAAYLVMGMPDKEIAASLGISPGTTKVYIGRILQKLDVDNRTQAAVALALRTTRSDHDDAGVSRR